MIRQTQWGAIRELWEAGRSKKAIAAELDLDIKTVRKWLKKGWRPREGGAREKELESQRSLIEARLPEIGFNGKVLERELRAEGWDWHYATLARFVSPLRRALRGGEEPTLRFETGPGVQAQVDWGSTAVVIGAEKVRIHVFTMVLGYSRRLFARAYRNEVSVDSENCVNLDASR